MFRVSPGLLFGVDEIDTPTGRAIVEERYATLRRQIPVIYLLALVNLAGLEIASGESLSIGLNLHTLIAACAVFRIAQWRIATKAIDHATMLRRMNQTGALTVAICLIVGVRCIYMLQVAHTESSIAVMLFGGFTAIGAAYGLSCHPVASRLPLLLLALPLAALAPLSKDWQSSGASMSLAVVGVLVLRLLSVHNFQFTELIRSRAMIEHGQQVAERARQEALVAATTDFLTGLPNRRAFVAALEAQLAERTESDCFAAAVVDLDRFKSINDTFGHGAGDDLLRIVARRLLSAAGDGALVARLGGDEFGLLFPRMKTEAEVRAVGNQILAEVNQPVIINARQFAASACCGFGIFRKGTVRTPSGILAEADLALYQAKANRAASGFAIFEPHMEASQRRRMLIERALQSPEVHEDISLVFQPIIDLQTGRVIANEALARWTDKEIGDISPSEFVPIAEQLNVIGGISEHLMVEALAEAKLWPDTVRLSLNLSAVQLCCAGSAESILEAVERMKLVTDQLQVEVTETALLADFDQARDNLAKLRSAGITIVLDDFGAGYASIGYLKELRFDQIKLDGGLVTAAQDNADGERLLAAVIGLCHALGVSTVAEHVESELQLKLLQRLGCTAGQGFWLEPPMAADAARELARASVIIGSGEKRVMSGISVKI